MSNSCAIIVDHVEKATSGEYNGMYRAHIRYAKYNVESENKLKGETLQGIQFCVNTHSLMPAGVNAYEGKEYYCMRKSI